MIPPTSGIEQDRQLARERAHRGMRHAEMLGVLSAALRKDSDALHTKVAKLGDEQRRELYAAAARMRNALAAVDAELAKVRDRALSDEDLCHE